MKRNSLLTCLYNADGEVVGYFSDYDAAMAARQEWNNSTFPSTKKYRLENAESCPSKCRSHEFTIAPIELENVEPGDGDRTDYVVDFKQQPISLLNGRIAGTIRAWCIRGAVSVEIQRFLINKYRRPNLSARDSDLGGPVDAAGVLYVLKIKAPK